MQNLRVSTKSRLPHHGPQLRTSSPSAPPRPGLGNVSIGGDESPNRVPGGISNGEGLKIIRSINYPPARKDIHGHPRRPRWEMMAVECNCPSPRIIGLIAATDAAKRSRNQYRHTGHSESNNMGGMRGDVGGRTLQKMRARGGKKLSKPS